jgi:hypothetical protein
VVQKVGPGVHTLPVATFMLKLLDEKLHLVKTSDPQLQEKFNIAGSQNKKPVQFTLTGFLG